MSYGKLGILQGILPIDKKRIPKELMAGVTLAALSIPQAMGYTSISGTPIITGLYTLLLPALLFALFGSSRHLVVGADSATAAIVAAGLLGMAPLESPEYTALAALLSLITGAILILARIIQLGFLADFLSKTVLIGFFSGVGIRIMSGQFGGMLGLESSGHSSYKELWQVLQHPETINSYALYFTVGVIILSVGADKWSKKIPGELLALVIAIFLVWFFDLSDKLAVLGEVPSGLPRFSLPEVDLSWALIEKLLPTAFSIVVVILAQSAATARAFASHYHERYDQNADILALAMANIGAGINGTFVVNGSPSKSSIVNSAGGRTQLSMVFMVLGVVLVLLFLTGPIAYLPKAVISAIVFIIGIKLIDVKGLKKVYKQSRNEFWIALITLLVVVFDGVEQGIFLAVVLSLIDHTRNGYRPLNVLLKRSEMGHWESFPLSSKEQALPGLIIYRFNHSMYYANSTQMSEEVMDLIKHADPPVKWFCLDASAVKHIDFTAAETIRSLYARMAGQNIQVVVAELGREVHLKELKLRKLVGKEYFYHSLENMCSDYEQQNPP